MEMRLLDVFVELLGVAFSPKRIAFPNMERWLIMGASHIFLIAAQVSRAK